MLLTIAEIAKRLNLPESTARYYRTRFEAWLPYIGEGRDRRYGEEAVNVLRFAAEAVKAGVPADIIKQRLDERYPAVQVADEPQRLATTGSPPPALIAFAEVVRELLSEQRDAALQEGKALRSAVDDLRNVVVESAATDRKTIVEQAEIIGMLKAELEALRAAQAPIVTSRAPESPDPPPEPSSPVEAPMESPANGSEHAPWWRRWRSWLAAGLVVAVVGSASCQTSASIKHAGLCTSARATMDFLATITESGEMVSNDIWAVVRDSIGTAEKVC
jgi:DNA-binding transcriptional MerR regulator